MVFRSDRTPHFLLLKKQCRKIYYLKFSSTLNIHIFIDNNLLKYENLTASKNRIFGKKNPALSGGIFRNYQQCRLLLIL